MIDHGRQRGRAEPPPAALLPSTTTDFLIIGAGFSGLVVAERLAAAGWKCVVVDRRDHLGGNAHDRTDAAGVLIHPYGPHYFRTNSPRVVEYLSRFTAWHEVAYTIKSHTRGRYWSFPINLNTFEEFLGRASSPAEFAAWLETGARADRASGELRGSDHLPGRPRTLPMVLRRLHAQAMAAPPARTRRLGLRAHPHPHQPRRPLSIGKLPGAARQRLHRPVRKPVSRQPGHRSPPRRGFPGGQSPLELSTPDLHRRDR